VFDLAQAAPPAHHYTAWEDLGYALLLSGIAFLVLCYWFAFKIKAKCMVIGSTTNEPCDLNATVVLGCKRHHRRLKPVAWIRHLGAARWLDPWLYRFHIVPPSFAPMPKPVARPAPAGTVLTITATTVAQVPAQAGGMSTELQVAIWSLAVGVIQAVTGLIALAATA
jgi:hypothetical protein